MEITYEITPWMLLPASEKNNSGVVAYCIAKVDDMELCRVPGVMLEEDYNNPEVVASVVEDMMLSCQDLAKQKLFGEE